MRNGNAIIMSASSCAAALLIWNKLAMHGSHQPQVSLAGLSLAPYHVAVLLTLSSVFMARGRAHAWRDRIVLTIGVLVK